MAIQHHPPASDAERPSRPNTMAPPAPGRAPATRTGQRVAVCNPQGLAALGRSKRQLTRREMCEPRRTKRAKVQRHELLMANPSTSRQVERVGIWDQIWNAADTSLAVLSPRPWPNCDLRPWPNACRGLCRSATAAHLHDACRACQVDRRLCRTHGRPNSAASVARSRCAVSGKPRSRWNLTRASFESSPHWPSTPSSLKPQPPRS